MVKSLKRKQPACASTIEQRDSVRQDNTESIIEMLEKCEEKSKSQRLAQFWHFRFTASKVDSQILHCIMNSDWIMEYGYQLEASKQNQRIPHFQGTFILYPEGGRKTWGQLSNLFTNSFPNLQFPVKDYLEMTKGPGSNKYTVKDEGRIDGPWLKGDRFEAIDTGAFKLDIVLTSWQEKIVQILDQKPHDRLIYWFWEPNGGIGKSTFQQWIYLNYERVIPLSGKASDIKNGVILHHQKHDKWPRVVLINICKAQIHAKIDCAGFEEVKDMFFYSPKYGEKGAQPEVCGKRPHMFFFANFEPRDQDMWSKDRLQIVRLPDGPAKETNPVLDWSKSDPQDLD